MKLTSRLLQLVAVTVGVSFAARVYAEPPRQEVVHAYVLLKHANHNYEVIAHEPWNISIRWQSLESQA